MDNKTDQDVQEIEENIPMQQPEKKREMSKVGKAIVKIFQDLLDFNMISYTKDKAPRL